MTTTTNRMPLRVLVCDDESMARRRARRLLTAIPNVQVDAECASAAEARARLLVEEFDVLLLDVQMPGETGLELAMSLEPPRPFLVFATAHAEHAVAAFEIGAVDYVLKPLEEDRLAKAMARARSWVEREGPNRAPVATLAAASNAPNASIALATRAGVLLFAAEDVSHCTFDGQLATVHASDGRKALTDLSLAELALKLPHLLRVHRRSLLSLPHVERLEPQLSGGYVAHVRGGGTVEVSRQAARDLRRRLAIT